MSKIYEWKVEIKVTSGGEPVDFHSLPAWAKESIMHMVGNGNVSGKVIFGSILEEVKSDDRQ